MNGIGSFLIGSETNIAKRNVLWNMAGSFIYALTSMLLGAVVTRSLGAAAGGIFFFRFFDLWAADFHCRLLRHAPGAGDGCGRAGGLSANTGRSGC